MKAWLARLIGFRLAIIETLTQDLRFACRVLIRDRGFAATAILVLGTGIGVNNLMFTLIYGSTLRGLPIEQPSRVLYISTFDQRFPDRALSYPEFDDIRRAARGFTGVAAFVNAPVAIGDEGRAADRFDGTYLTANAFDVVGTGPAIGRGLTAEDDRPGAPPVVVLGRRAWRGRYGGDPSILGRTILVNGAPVTVVGVMPDPSRFPSTAEVWLPLSQMPGLAIAQRDIRMLRVFGRLREDVTAADVSAEVEAIVERAARDHPASSEGLKARIVPIHERFFGHATQPTWLAFITASILIVVVSCANAANLLLSRSVLRAREIAIRGSLGASRSRIVGQLLIESVVLAALGGAFGLCVSLGAARIFRSTIPEFSMPYWFDYTMDAAVVGALVVVSFLTVLVFGLVPALQASKADVNRVLKDGGRSGIRTGGARRLTAVFLTAEIALTVILLAQAVVSARNDGYERAADAPIDTTRLLTASVALPAAPYSTPERRHEFYTRAIAQIAAIPGVTSASVTSALPLHAALPQSLDIEGQTRSPGDKTPTVSTITIGSRYFETLTLPLRLGHAFSDDDGLPGRAHVIVSQRFADSYFPGADPLGRRIRLAMANAPAAAHAWHTIIGVSTDVRQQGVTGIAAVVYLPVAGAPPSAASLVVRSSLDPANLTPSLREAVMSVDPNLPLYRVMTLEAVIREAQWAGRVSNGLITMLTCVALLLSIAGLYAVTMYAVGQRTQEIGLRMALGARPGDIRRLILRHAYLQVGLGLALGLAGALVWDAAFFSGRVNLRLFAPGILIPISALLAGATGVACLVPARRATRLDPAATLRGE